MERGSAGHDDEKRHDDGPHRADDHVPNHEFIVCDFDPLLDDCRLHIELHPRGDGRTHEPQHHTDIVLVPLYRRPAELFPDFGPMRFREHRRYNVRKEKNAEQQKYPFGGLIVALDHQKPDRHRGDGHRNIFARAEHHHAPGNARELRGRIADIGDKQANENIKRDFDAEILADKIGKALARHDPHARVHFLDRQ